MAVFVFFQWLIGIICVKASLVYATGVSVSNYTALVAAITRNAIITVKQDIKFPAGVVIPVGFKVTISDATPGTALDGSNVTKHFYVEGRLVLGNIALANGFADPNGAWPTINGGAVFLAYGSNGT